MPKANNNEDQFKFLISCIRYSNNGKIDFEKVAEECDVVTKGAAAKRYERMMKAHNIHQPQGPSGRDTGVQPLKPKSKAKSSEPVTKKRKRGSPKHKGANVKKEDTSDFDDDFNEDSAVKTEEDFEVKQEEDNDAIDNGGEDEGEEFNDHANSSANEVSSPLGEVESMIGEAAGLDGAFDISGILTHNMNDAIPSGS